MTRHGIHIGTSGWHYTHWQGPFYPEDLRSEHWLSFYARQFSCAEINNSFYRLPSADTFGSWADQTPNRFVFAVKAPRTITHMKKLKNCEDPLGTFLENVRGLGSKLGPILFQLPPRWHCNLNRLQGFLALLPLEQRFAFEFRDASWHNADVLALLTQHNAAFCIFDLAGVQSTPQVTADFVYVRLHGPGQDAYTGSYRAPTLRRWADKILGWRRKKKDVYVFFDNDQAGYAVKNAQRLQHLVATELPSAS